MHLLNLSLNLLVAKAKEEKKVKRKGYRRSITFFISRTENFIKKKRKL